MVIAPSMMPKKPRDRIKNDRRDAVTLARLLRAGELTAIWVPDEYHEAVVIRLGRGVRRKAILLLPGRMLLGFLLRQGRRFPGGTNWTRMHWRWLGEQAFPSPHQQFVFSECVRRIEEAQAPVQGWAYSIGDHRFADEGPRPIRGRYPPYFASA